MHSTVSRYIIKLHHYDIISNFHECDVTYILYYIIFILTKIYILLYYIRETATKLPHTRKSCILFDEVQNIHRQCLKTIQIMV